MCNKVMADSFKNMISVNALAKKIVNIFNIYRHYSYSDSLNFTVTSDAYLKGLNT